MPLHALARAGLAVTLLLGLVGTAHALTLKSEEFKTHRRPAVTFLGKGKSSPLAEYIPHRRIGTVCACPPVRRYAAPDVPQLWDHGHGAAIP